MNTAPDTSRNTAQNAAPAFGRLITAMVTPFAADRSLDLKRAQELACDLVRRGNDALILSGSTGESSTLTHDEKLKLFQAVLDAVAGAAPVIANVGDYCTASSVAFAKEAEQLGADGIMAVVPYYNKPPQEGIYQHFKAIAEAISIPVILYNIPGRCVINMEAATTLRLANDCGNIRAVKEASGNFEQIGEIVRGAPEGFTVYSGDDQATIPLMAMGGYGLIATAGNVVPEGMREIVYAMAAGDFGQALSCHSKLQPLMKALFATSNPILVKAAMSMAGFDVGGVRLPLIDATEPQKQKLRAVMDAVGL
ncbi:MAG: 4-hydroxy-tetrahydrodipicolinate synthase [Actinomycetia bacterium]|nr:4-hydroxy-tetrahydrodipicolinate synthase [Actinomycetes bacterium]